MPLPRNDCDVMLDPRAPQVAQRSPRRWIDLPSHEVGRLHLAQVFGIETRGQGCRANEIAEHHRLLSPLCAIVTRAWRHSLRDGGDLLGHWHATPGRGKAMRMIYKERLEPARFFSIVAGRAGYGLAPVVSGSRDVIA